MLCNVTDVFFIFALQMHCSVDVRVHSMYTSTLESHTTFLTALSYLITSVNRSDLVTHLMQRLCRKVQRVESRSIYSRASKSLNSSGDVTSLHFIYFALKLFLLDVNHVQNAFT